MKSLSLFLIIIALSISTFDNAMDPFLINNDVRVRQYDNVNLDKLCFEFYGNTINLPSYGIDKELIFEHIRDNMIKWTITSHEKEIRALKSDYERQRFLLNKIREFDRNPPTCSLQVILSEGNNKPLAIELVVFIIKSMIGSGDIKLSFRPDYDASLYEASLISELLNSEYIQGLVERS